MKENHDNSKERQDVEVRYKSFIESLDEFNEDLRKIKGKNKELLQLQESLLMAVSKVAFDAKEKARIALEVIPWDRLVIGFFGETNAGKSTIIETLRILYDKNRSKNTDGTIVGDGRQDFTQTYTFYELKIDGKDFTLVDVPGIEGNEKYFVDTINDALRRVHIIFYVHGKNQRPDQGTAKKIKDYLADWVKVYSIQNTKGGTSNYDEEEERLTLLTPQVQTVSKQVEEDFNGLLGTNYKGNIPVQALIAMCAYANFDESRDDLKKAQKKFLNYFENPKAMFEFSRFNELEALVRQNVADFRNEILLSNKQKVSALARQTYRQIEKIVQDNQKRVDDFKKNLSQFKRDVTMIVDSANKKIEREVNNSISTEFNQLARKIDSAIDDDKDNLKGHIESLVRSTSYTLNSQISSIAQKAVREMIDQVDKKKKAIQGISQVSTGGGDIGGLSIDFGIESALQELEVNMDDVGEYATNIGGFAAGGITVGAFFGPVGMAIGGGVGALVGLAKKMMFGDDKKQKAKLEIHKSLEDQESEYKTALRPQIATMQRKLTVEKWRIHKLVDNELDNLNSINSLIWEIESNMNLHISINDK